MLRAQLVSETWLSYEHWPDQPDILVDRSGATVHSGARVLHIFSAADDVPVSRSRGTVVLEHRRPCGGGGMRMYRNRWTFLPRREPMERDGQ